MIRYRIATLVGCIAIIAMLLAWFQPLNPDLKVFEIVDIDKRLEYKTDTKQYELTVVNSGTSSLWLPDASDPATDVTFKNDPHTEDFTFVNILFDDRSATRLDPGNGLVYNLFVTARFRKNDVGIEVQDWRGRHAFYETRLRFVGDSTDNG